MPKVSANNTAKATAVRLLSRRDHSVQELRQKLSKREFSQDEIEAVLDELIARDYLSDERFAVAYVHIRQQKGFGPLRIASELKQRGVNDSVYQPILRQTDEPWIVTIERAYQSKYRGKPFSDYNEKAKRIRFLQYRGFSLDEIHDIIS